MAIFIKEYLGGVNVIQENSSSAGINIKESAAPISVAEDSVMVDVEGIHVGPTRNFTWYTEQALKSSVPTWTKPYRRPLILHHNEKDGKIIGRVLNAVYTDVNTRSKTGALIFTCNVADEDGKKGVKDGRFETTSVGVIGTDVRCSICGKQIEFDENGSVACGHEKGSEYETEIGTVKTCYWMIYEMEAKELSYVIVPSDIYAHNLKIYEPNAKTIKSLQENVQEGECVIMTKKVTEVEVTEAVKVEENGEKPEAVKVPDAPKVEEQKEEVKEEPVKEEPKEDKVAEAIAKLEKDLAELKAELEAEKSLREKAESELVSAQTELKEFAIEQMLSLREKLGRPSLEKNNIMSRSKDSIMDAIFDLKEELGFNAKKTVNLTEGAEEIKETAKTPEETLKAVTIPVTESLIDENKDSSIKKSTVDVKEAEEFGNIDYEAAYVNLSSYYNL